MASTTIGAASGRAPAFTRARPSEPGLLTLDVRKITALLWIATAIVLALGISREVLVHLFGTATALKDLRHFSLDSEHSLPAWYESITMLAAAGVLGVLAALSRRDQPRNWLPWTLLAVIFLIMSIDEAVAFHEVTIAPLRQAFNLSGFLYFSWVIIAAPVLIALAVYYIPFLLRLPPRTAVRFCIAGAMFVGGAFGLEFVGGYYASKGGFDYLPYKIAAASEELLEISGMTLFLSSLLQHLVEQMPTLAVEMKD